MLTFLKPNRVPYFNFISKALTTWKAQHVFCLIAQSLVVQLFLCRCFLEIRQNRVFINFLFWQFKSYISVFIIAINFGVHTWQRSQPILIDQISYHNCWRSQLKFFCARVEANPKVIHELHLQNTGPASKCTWQQFLYYVQYAFRKYKIFMIHPNYCMPDIFDIIADNHDPTGIQVQIEDSTDNLVTLESWKTMTLTWIRAL